MKIFSLVCNLTLFLHNLQSGFLPIPRTGMCFIDGRGNRGQLFKLSVGHKVIGRVRRVGNPVHVWFRRAYARRIMIAFKNVNPPGLIRFREYRRGFQTQHGLLSMPATLGRSGYLTTDTAQTQWLCRAAKPSAGASGFALDAQSTA